MRSSSRSAKGQFFIVSAASIVIILFFIGRWLQPSAIPDTSSTASTEELFIFDNIREKTEAAIKGSGNCEELEYNLQEYRSFLLGFAREKNYQISFEYSITPCFEELGSVAEIFLRVRSEKADASGTFFVTWP